MFPSPTNHIVIFYVAAVIFSTVLLSLSLVRIISSCLQGRVFVCASSMNCFMTDTVYIVPSPVLDKSTVRQDDGFNIQTRLS